MADTPTGWLQRALGFVYRIEDAILAILLTTMILLAASQIFLRNFFDEGIIWADPAIRALVLWVALIGALAATRSDRHIRIDVLSHVLPERVQAGVRALTSLFAAAVCGVVAYHATLFVQSEIEYETIAFGSVPTWWIELVIPVTFALIGLRFVLLAAGSVRDAALGPRAEEA